MTTSLCSRVSGSQGGMSWFAIRVMSNRERVVAAALRGRLLDVCLPVYRSPNRRNRGNTGSVLFSGYVFCCFQPADFLTVLTVPGVVHIVGVGNVPEPINPAEMLAVQKLADSNLSSEPYSYLHTGQLIRVVNGPLEGVEGLFLRKGNQDRIVISVSLLSRSVIANVERSCIEPMVGKSMPGNVKDELIAASDCWRSPQYSLHAVE